MARGRRILFSLFVFTIVVTALLASGLVAAGDGARRIGQDEAGAIVDQLERSSANAL